MPVSRRCTLASNCPQTEPLDGSARDRFHDRKPVSVSKFRPDGRVNVVASGGRKSIQVIAVRVAGTTDSGDMSSCIEVWWDERTELGSLMVWVEFVVDFLPDKLC